MSGRRGTIPAGAYPQIVERVRAGETYVKIGETYGVVGSAIYSFLNRRGATDLLYAHYAARPVGPRPVGFPHTITPQPTPTALQVLAAVAQFTTANGGTAPIVRDVADQVGLSVTRTRQHLVRLQTLGLVDWTPGTQRTLRVTPAGHTHLRQTAGDPPTSAQEGPPRAPR